MPKKALKKFRVVFAMSYDVTAETEEDAIAEAKTLFEEDIAKSKDYDCFGVDVHELD